jgi:hypothetical protein
MDKIHARNATRAQLISCWMVRWQAPALVGTKPTDEVFDNLQEALEFEAWCKRNGKAYELAQSTNQPRWIKQKALRPVPAMVD